MHTSSHRAHGASVRPFQLSLLAVLCTGLWCGSPRAAPDPGNPNRPAPLPSAPQNIQALPNVTQGGTSSAASARRLAIGGVLAVGLWQAWRSIDSAAQPAAPPAPPVASFDPDRPIPMDGIDTVGALADYSIRRLMDTLGELRRNKQYDCDHGKTSQRFLCDKIRLVKAALGLEGATYFGDESNDGCGCR